MSGQDHVWEGQQGCWLENACPHRPPSRRSGFREEGWGLMNRGPRSGSRPLVAVGTLVPCASSEGLGSRAAGSPQRLLPPQMLTGSTTSAAWPGWTSTRWSPPPTTPLSKSGQSPTEGPPPLDGPNQGLELNRSRTRRFSTHFCPAPPRPAPLSREGPSASALVSAGCPICTRPSESFRQ